MKQRYRRGFSTEEKTELWGRWQRGESLKAIGRAFGKPSSSIYFQLAPHGGIRPAPRRRSRLALSLSEREEISRGIAAERSIRSLARLAEQIRELQARIAMLDGEIKTWFGGNELARRLETIPGIGFITASALAASVTDPHRFTSARQFAASLGLTPKADCSGGRERMGRISKMGDRYLRRLLVNGRTSQLQSARRKPDAYPWVAGLLASKPNKLVAVAMANKAARIAWVVMTRGEVYRAHRPATEGTA